LNGPSSQYMKQSILLSSLILFVAGMILIANAVIAYGQMQRYLNANPSYSFNDDYAFTRFESFAFSLCFGLAFIAFSIFTMQYKR